MGDYQHSSQRKFDLRIAAAAYRQRCGCDNRIHREGHSQGLRDIDVYREEICIMTLWYRRDRTVQKIVVNDKQARRKNVSIGYLCH